MKPVLEMLLLCISYINIQESSLLDFVEHLEFCLFGKEVNLAGLKEESITGVEAAD